MKQTYRERLSFSTAILCILVCNGAWAATPTSADFAAASQRSRARLSKETLEWTVDHGVGNGKTLSVRVVKSGGQSSWTVASPEFDLPMIRIIERDGVWYVSEGDSRYKCRPHEAPLQLPTFTFLLARSELLLWEDPKAELGKLVSTDGQVATFKQPVAGATANELKQATKTMRESLPQIPPQSRAEIQARLTTLERRLLEGDDIKLSIADGVVLEQSSTTPTVKVHDLRWNPRLDAKEFVPDPTENWEDRTVAWKTPPMGWTMIGHAAAWRPGSPTFDTDAVLLDLNSGSIRRLPYPYGLASPGCFSNDRSKVFVIGTSAFAGMMLFEIDLKTGSNKKVTSAYELESGPLLFPTLSPDGSTVALLSTSAGKVLEAQVWLIDVATGRAKKLGVPFDTSKLSWLPDGRGLIAVSRKKSPEQEQAVVCRLGLDGQLTELCQGSSPVVLGNSPKILFDARNGDASRWMICDLNGKNAQQLGDGLAKFGFPSPSQDGSQVLMMRFGGTDGPKPTIVNVATGEAKAIPTGPGLWVMPGWR
jgi:hypothetical protein